MMPPLQQIAPFTDEGLREDARTVFDNERRLVRRTFRRKMETAPHPPREGMPPQERRDEISQQMPGSVASGKVREFMRKHHFLLGSSERLLEAGGQTDRGTQDAERDRRSNLRKLCDGKFPAQPKALRDSMGTFENVCCHWCAAACSGDRKKPAKE